MHACCANIAAAKQVPRDAAGLCHLTLALPRHSTSLIHSSAPPRALLYARTQTRTRTYYNPCSGVLDPKVVVCSSQISTMPRWEPQRVIIAKDPFPWQGIFLSSLKKFNHILSQPWASFCFTVGDENLKGLLRFLAWQYQRQISKDHFFIVESVTCNFVFHFN